MDRTRPRSSTVRSTVVIRQWSTISRPRGPSRSQYFRSKVRIMDQSLGVETGSSTTRTVPSRIAAIRPRSSRTRRAASGAIPSAVPLYTASTMIGWPRSTSLRAIPSSVSGSRGPTSEGAVSRTAGMMAPARRRARDRSACRDRDRRRHQLQFQGKSAARCATLIPIPRRGSCFLPDRALAERIPPTLPSRGGSGRSAI